MRLACEKEYNAPLSLAHSIDRHTKMRFNSLCVLILFSPAVSANSASDPISPVPADAAGWPEFRGPTGQGLSTADSLPVEWGPDRNITWKVAIPGKGWSSPIVWRGEIYLTTAVPQGADDGDRGPQSLRALKLDASSGKAEWNIELFQHDGARIHTKNSHASPTPVTDGERIYVHFGTYGTAALAFDGRVIWRNRELRYDPVHGSGGSPALAGGALFINCDGSDRQFVVALDCDTGEILWRKERPWDPERGFSFSTPLLIEAGERKEIVSAASDGVSAYDPKTGDEIWRVRYPGGYSIVPRPVFGHGLVFVCTGYDRPSLLAIRPGEHGDVTKTNIAWRLDRGAPNNPSPLLLGDEIYLASDNGIATCLDARTGKEHWRRRLGGSYSASPIAAAGKLYFLSEAGETVVLRAGRETEEIARNELRERSLASPAVAGEALLIRTEKHLFRIEEEREKVAE